LKKAEQPLQALKEIEENVQAIQQKIEAPVERKSEQRSAVSSQSLKLGERVIVSTLNSEGVITALGESDAEVQIGSLRVRARLTDLVRRSGEQSPVSSNQPVDDRPTTSASRPKGSSTGSSPGIELNLRGKLVEDGLEELDRYLERAYSSGLLFVRIVHGKGTGRLREAVRNALKSSPYVASFEEPKDNEGGAGVTVAKMAK
jgi:DNA mismatch repair protein MutS2